MKNIHFHMVSDSTGETVSLVARACLAQFEDVSPRNHNWNMVRTEKQVDEILAAVGTNRGFVLYTLVDDTLRVKLEDGCRRLQVPCIALLDPIIGALGRYLGAKIEGRPGRQHEMDAEYFNRIDAMQFVLSHDDGQMTRDLEQADVVVLGVSRTSKTPTCIYLANRGIKAANIPIVPGCPVPDIITKITKPLIVGLTNDPKQLVQIRRNRLRMLNQDEETDYVDIETVSAEVHDARRLFTKNNWPVIDVTRRSIEETAAQILTLYNRRREETP
ncbi:MAG: pyruvate, water dikinase regulatory protein [Rhodospirillales bacterium]